MHALVRRIDAQVLSQAPPERGDERVPLVAIHFPHSANVSCEVTLFHEGSDHHLAKGRWLAVHEITRGNEGTYERGGHDGVAEPQPWKKRLVEGSDIDDALGLIEALQRSEWPAAISEFAGVVVFDNPGALLARPGEKFKTTGHRQGNTLRKLVRGRNEHGARFWRTPDAFGDIDAMLVDRNGADLRACRDQR